MGHREKLLKGARQCLYERGYGGTTARDIVAASGTNLASIGYHFGSKEDLLNAAMIEAIGEWGQSLAELFADATPGGDPLEQFERNWTRVIDSFQEHRAVLMASFEAFTQIDRNPELRELLADGYERSRSGLTATLMGPVDLGGAESTRAVGAFNLALLTGLMAQTLMDPKRSPTGAEVAGALATLTDVVRASAREPE